MNIMEYFKKNNKNIDMMKDIDKGGLDLIKTSQLEQMSDFAKINEEYEFKILAVDDDEVNLYVLANYMNLKNIAIDTTYKPEEVMEKIENNHYDLVLLDIMMPKISGYDICLKIREQFSISQLPIIMLTAKNDISNIVKGFECGANDYVTKPFAYEELMGRIKNLLMLKYSVEHSIEYFIRMESEKNKNLYLEKIKSFENMISITYSEKNSEKALSIILTVIISAFDNLFKNIYYYEYDEIKGLYRQQYVMPFEDAVKLKDNYFDNFLKNMDFVYEKIKGMIKTERIIIARKGESKNYELLNMNKMDILENSGKSDDFFGNSDYFIVLPIVYGETRYGTIVLETGNKIIEDNVIKYLQVFGENLSVYLEKQKLEREKIENQSCKDFRCVKCNRKLFAYRSTIPFLEIKCPKCDTINKI